MENREMSMSMSRRECRWVRARLPLWVADQGVDRTESNREGGDLSGEEQHRVQQHLAICPACRGEQAILGRAFRALMVAAAESPLNRTEPSLWPELERRINRRSAAAPSKTADSLPGLVGRWLPISGVLERARERVGSVVIFGTAGSILMSLVAGTVVLRQRIDAVSKIERNRAPLVHEVTPTISDDAMSRLAELDRDSENSSNHVAETDPTLVAETSTSMLTTVPAKPATNTRFNDDADHSTAVAPDARESKPVY
jgi:hypothetical protein